ncbi:MAG: 2-amino-4-hydroxy-6-hydroxymethyldihydropteridine diphosphokinase, partial [Gammaproteobacteria bacterium]|nr:2-amino-4-hydroxy-6-hydroxymethyldihydropteridine diphosphokinase [Gammaproteobacteria bacterium]
MNTQPPATDSREFAEAAIVAVGSNLPGRFGPPRQMAQQALAELRRLSVRQPLCSSLYRT